jgi:hypothetical protein
MPFIVFDNSQGRGQRAINVDRIEYADYEQSLTGAPGFPRLKIKLVGVQGTFNLSGQQAEDAWETISGTTHLINVSPEPG